MLHGHPCGFRLSTFPPLFCTIYLIEFTFSTFHDFYFCLFHTTHITTITWPPTAHSFNWMPTRPRHREKLSKIKIIDPKTQWTLWWLRLKGTHVEGITKTTPEISTKSYMALHMDVSETINTSHVRRSTKVQISLHGQLIKGRRSYERISQR